MNRWQGKRVFISGGAGVIGMALVHRLAEWGADLFVGDLKPKPVSWPSSIRYRQGDLVGLTSREIDEFSPQVFFHLAAAFERSEETYEFWDENFHHNIFLSHHLLSLLKESSSLEKIVFASSYLIYDPSQYLFLEPQLKAASLKESSLIAPRNLCGMAKLLHEQELMFIKKFRPHLQVICTRIFRSYGKNSNDVISRWIRLLLSGESIHVYAIEGCFDFIYAEDVAEGLISLAGTTFNGIVNLGSGHSRTIREVVNILRHYFAEMIIEEQISKIPYEASVADMQTFQNLTGRKAFRALEETLPELIAFERHKRVDGLLHP